MLLCGPPILDSWMSS